MTSSACSTALSNSFPSINSSISTKRFSISWTSDSTSSYFERISRAFASRSSAFRLFFISIFSRRFARISSMSEKHSSILCSLSRFSISPIPVSSSEISISWSTATSFSAIISSSIARAFSILSSCFVSSFSFSRYRTSSSRDRSISPLSRCSIALSINVLISMILFFGK